MEKKRGQLSMENIILVGIVLAILVPSIFLFYRSVSMSEETKSELHAIGTDLVAEIGSMKTSGEGSWQTYTFNYRGAKGRVYTENGNELIITADQNYPFFLGKEENIVIEDNLAVKPGKNTIKISSKDGIVCLSSREGTCDFTLCRDEDQDFYSWRGKGECCGPSGNSPCGEVRDCDDHDMQVHPGLPEICDKKDNDCNGLVDETFDVDQDYYPWDVYATQCSPSYTGTLDCLDNDPYVHPGVEEVCDGKDNDCNPGTQEGSLPMISCTDPRAGVLLGWCAEGQAYCDSTPPFYWQCQRQPGDRREDCDDLLHVDEDCDGFANIADADCQELFFADYDHIVGDPGFDWLIADKCIGTCTPLFTQGVAADPGINDTSVLIATNGELRYATDQNIDLTKGTLEFWMKTQSSIPWDDGTQRTFLFFSNGQDGVLLQSINLRKLTYGDLQFYYIKNDVMASVIIGNVFNWNPDAWYFYAMTWNTDMASLKIYIDGQLLKDVALDMTSWPTSLTAFSLGAVWRPPEIYSIFGKLDIDNFQIYHGEKDGPTIMEDYLALKWDYWGTCTAPGGLGDVNRNGCLDGIDKNFFLNYLQGSFHPDNATLACMDINQDHHVTQADLDAFHADHCNDCITLINTCKAWTPPLFCNGEGLWISNCQSCGCPTWYTCEPNGICVGDGGGSPVFNKDEYTWDQGMNGGPG